MKKLVLKFLLGRGVGVLQEVLSKAVRHGLTVYGGYLAGAGYIESGDLVTLESAAVILIGLGLSVARTFLSSRVSL